VDDVLASVRGVVDLSPHEALDAAQDFLTRQGYSGTLRTTTTLTVERQVSDNASGQESVYKLIVMALPQSGGGVWIKVRGNDREAVRDHQAAWLEWSETLPKRETEQPETAATTESVTRETVGQEAPRPTTAADNDMPQRRYCSNCGHELSPEDQFCPNCGRPVHETAQVRTSQANVEVPPLSGAGTSQQAQQQRRRGMFGSAFGIGLGGCLGIVAAFIVVFFLIAFCAAAISGGGGKGAGNNEDAPQTLGSGSELAPIPRSAHKKNSAKFAQPRSDTYECTVIGPGLCWLVAEMRRGRVHPPSASGMVGWRGEWVGPT